MLPGIAGCIGGLTHSSFGPSDDGQGLMVLVAGQSNARSYGTTGSDIPPALQTVDNGILIWNTLTNAFETYGAGVNSDTWNSGATTPQKWGPEAAFAHAFRAANPATNLYIVKIAVDSATLATQAGQDWNPANSGELFEALESEIDLAEAALIAGGRTPNAAALLWMQGEHDALDSTMATNYGINLAAFNTAVRSRWGAAATKIILGRITPSSQWTSGTSVRAFQARVARDAIGVQAINTDGYTLAADNKHYIAASVQTMGEDMFAAFAGTYPLLPVRFGTMAADKSASVTLSNSNLTAAGTGTNSSDLQTVRSDQVPNGKSYWEILIDARAANLSAGLGKNVATNQYWGQVSDSIGYVSATGAVFKNAVQILTYGTYTAGDRVMIALDSTTGKVWFGKNGTWNGDPAAGTGQAATLSAAAADSYHRFGATLRRSGDQVTLKCAVADFAYTPPSGFSAI